MLDVGRLEENALNDVAVQNLIVNMRNLLNNEEFSDVKLVRRGEAGNACLLAGLRKVAFWG